MWLGGVLHVAHGIALAAAKRGAEAGEKCTQQQTDEHPQGGPGGDFCCGVCGFLGFDLGVFNRLVGFGIHLIDPLLGLGLAEVGPLSDDLRQIGTVLTA